MSIFHCTDCATDIAASRRSAHLEFWCPAIPENDSDPEINDNADGGAAAAPSQAVPAADTGGWLHSIVDVYVTGANLELRFEQQVRFRHRGERS